MKRPVSKQKAVICFKRVVSTVCFLAVIGCIYASATYLFRGETLNDFHDDRRVIVGIKEEDPLDMVYVGGSLSFCSWLPLQAWEEHGLVSYDLGSTSIQAENILYLIKHALKYQDPELFVIDVWPFVDYSYAGYEGGLRYTSDALDLGPDRLKLIREYYDRRHMEGDPYSVYLDISKHHSRYEVLASPGAWELMDNRGESPYKGAKMLDTCYYLETPRYETGKKRDLDPGAEEKLYDLLRYCKEEELNVLFVTAPTSMRQEDYEKHCTIEDIIEDYGYPILNANRYYEQIGYDFAEDYADSGHMNVLGAEKYTSFLGAYLEENYDLPDHRALGDIDWTEDHAGFAEAKAEAEKRVTAQFQAAQEGKRIAEELAGTEDVNEWCAMAADPRFSLLAVGEEEILHDLSEREKESMEKIGLSDTGSGHRMMWVSNGSKLLMTNAAGESRMETMLGPGQNIACVICDEDQAASVSVQEKEYSRQDKDGINIVVVENDYRYAADSVTIRLDPETGSLCLIR